MAPSFRLPTVEQTNKKSSRSMFEDDDPLSHGLEYEPLHHMSSRSTPTSDFVPSPKALPFSRATPASKAAPTIKGTRASVSIPAPRTVSPRKAPQTKQTSAATTNIKRKADVLTTPDGDTVSRTGQPSRKKWPNFGQPDAEFVMIEVGPQLQPFRLHRHVLEHYSAYIKHVFDSGNHIFERGFRIHILKNVTPKVFELMNNWLYNQELGHGPDPITGVEPMLELMDLAILWSLAEKKSG